MRRLTDDDIAFAKPLLEANAPTANIAQVISNQRNCKVLPEQIAHIRRVSRYFVLIHMFNLVCSIYRHVVCRTMT